MNQYERQKHYIAELENKIHVLNGKLETCRQLNDVLYSQNRQLENYLRELERLNAATKNTVRNNISDAS